jgi:hypothetical protein
MRRILEIAGLFWALSFGAQAAVTLDFTNTTTGDNAASYTYDDYDLFGDGSLTVDMTVTPNANTLDKIANGWGRNGDSGRLDAGESLSFTFSDLQGSVAADVTGFEFVGLVSSVADAAVWTQSSDDVIDVNGVTLTTYDAAQSDPITMAYTDIAPYDLQDDFVTAGDDTSALTISTNGSFLIEQIADSGRISGFQINVLSTANLVPVADAQSVSALYETPLEITLSGSDEDNGPSNLTYSVETQPIHGDLNGATNLWTYTPSAGYYGADSFTFTVNDGDSNSAPATVSITVVQPILSGTVIGVDFCGDTTPDPDNWNLLIDPGNDIVAGALTDTNGTVISGVAFTTAVTGSGTSGGNDSSDESSAYPLLSTNAQEDWWYESSTDGVFLFEFTGLDDTLAYTLVIGGYRVTTDSDQVANGSTAWVVGGMTNTTVVNDLDDSYVTFTGLTSSNGVLVITSVDDDGTVSGGWTLNDIGSVSALRLTAYDVGQNLSPVAVSQSLTTFPEVALDITLTGNDPDSSPSSNLTYAVASQPSHGVLVTNGALPDLTYTPDNGYQGADSFTFTVNDGASNSAPATVSIAVTNQAPSATAQGVTTAHATALPITLSGNDPDNGPNSNLTYVVTSLPSNGTLDTNSLPNVTYTPNSDYAGADSFSFTVSDGWDVSAVADVSITVEAVATSLAVGMVIGIDFGNDDGQTANWNNLGAINTGLAEGDLMNTDGDIINGVAFSSSGASGENNAGEYSSSYSSIPASAQGDWWFEATEDVGFTLTFTGLDDSLTYDLTIGAYNTEATESPTLENSRTEWVAGGTNKTTVAGDLVGSYVIFTGLASSGGILTITSVDDDGNTIGAVSALMLTVAEAGDESGASMISATVSGGSLVLSWDGDGIYNVLTNANLLNADGWGIVTNGVSSPVTNTIGSEAQLFYKLSE